MTLQQCIPSSLFIDNLLPEETFLASAGTDVPMLKTLQAHLLYNNAEKKCLGLSCKIVNKSNASLLLTSYIMFALTKHAEHTKLELSLI